MWPEPPKRVTPPVCAALVLPDDVACPEGCERFSFSEDLDPLLASKLRESFLRDADDSTALITVSSLIALTEKMGKNEICSGLALVRDVTKAMTSIVQHVTTVLSNRVLVVCVGDGNVPSHITEDRETVVVQMGSAQTAEESCKYYIRVCLKKGCSDTSGFVQAVFGLLLPLGYEYDPSLVVLVRMPDSGVSDSLWQQLTGLLQSFALGHTLVLLQEEEKALVGLTASSLLGNPAPSLKQLQAPLTEDVEAIERLRHRLQADWKLLQTTAPQTQRSDEH